MRNKRMLIIFVLMTSVLASLFSTGKPEESIDHSNDVALNVFVSILPQEYFVKKIGGNRVAVEVMVSPGKNPATYEPTPGRISLLSGADVFFSIGVPFEKGFLPKIKNTIPHLKIVDTSKGIERKSMAIHGAGNTDVPDPHIWMSPELVKIQAQNIFEALVMLDPQGRAIYTEGLKGFLAELEMVDNQIKNALRPYKGSPFFIFHPSMGYFADSYNLVQIAVEEGGKEPSVLDLSNFIKKAKNAGVKIVFVQPEFSKDAANVIADAIGGSVVSLRPLDPDYINNLLGIADEIRKSYN